MGMAVTTAKKALCSHSLLFKAHRRVAVGKGLGSQETVMGGAMGNPILSKLLYSSSLLVCGGGEGLTSLPLTHPLSIPRLVWSLQTSLRGHFGYSLSPPLHCWQHLGKTAQGQVGQPVLGSEKPDGSLQNSGARLLGWGTWVGRGGATAGKSSPWFPATYSCLLFC